MSASTGTIAPVAPRGRVGPLITRQAMLLAAILLFIAFAVTAGSFASPGNLGNILRQMASVLVLGLAMTMAVMVGGIESSEVLANRARRLLGPRPGNWLIAWQPLLLACISSDQARIDRKTLATNQASRNALRHHALKYPA